MTPDDDAVERYLDDVADNLRGQGREVRRVLAEVEQLAQAGAKLAAGAAVAGLKLAGRAVGGLGRVVGR